MLVGLLGGSFDLRKASAFMWLLSLCVYDALKWWLGLLRGDLACVSDALRVIATSGRFDLQNGSALMGAALV